MACQKRMQTRQGKCMKAKVNIDIITLLVALCYTEPLQQLSTSADGHTSLVPSREGSGL